MNYLLKSINLLNILLAAAAVATAHYVMSPVASKEVRYTPPIVKVLPAEKSADKQKAETGTAVPPIDYTLIADQNLFHPDRKIPVEKPAAAVVQPLPKPDLELYGTLITDTVSLAYVNDRNAPLSTPGRGERLKVLKKGDVLNGFVVKTIENDKITLARGDEVMTVILMYHQAKPAAPAQQYAPGRPVPAVPATSLPGGVNPNQRRRR